MLFSESDEEIPKQKPVKSPAKPRAKLRKKFELSDSDSSDEEENRKPKSATKKETIKTKNTKTAPAPKIAAKCPKYNLSDIDKSSSDEAENPEPKSVTRKTKPAPKIAEKCPKYDLGDSSSGEEKNEKPTKKETVKPKNTKVISPQTSVTPKSPENRPKNLDKVNKKVRREPIVRIENRVAFEKNKIPEDMPNLVEDSPKIEKNPATVTTPKMTTSKWKAPRFNNSKSTRGNTPQTPTQNSQNVKTPTRLGFGLSRPKNSPQIVKFRDKL